MCYCNANAQIDQFNTFILTKCHLIRQTNKQKLMTLTTLLNLPTVSRTEAQSGVNLLLVYKMLSQALFCCGDDGGGGRKGESNLLKPLRAAVETSEVKQ